MDTPQDKGDALENAVAAIEEVILQSSAGIGRKPIIEKKKIIIVNSVRHEIDVYVTADLAPGYESIFVFECKNWKALLSPNVIDESAATSTLPTNPASFVSIWSGMRSSQFAASANAMCCSHL